MNQTKPKYTFCYCVVSPESAARGESLEHGFYDIGGWTYPIDENGKHGYDVENYIKTPGSLKAAILEAQNLGITEDTGNWFSSFDPDRSMETGEETTYSFHLEGVTEFTRARIARVLAGRPVFGR